MRPNQQHEPEYHGEDPAQKHQQPHLRSALRRIDLKQHFLRFRGSLHRYPLTRWPGARKRWNQRFTIVDRCPALPR